MALHWICTVECYVSFIWRENNFFFLMLFNNKKENCNFYYMYSSETSLVYSSQLINIIVLVIHHAFVIIIILWLIFMFRCLQYITPLGNDLLQEKHALYDSYMYIDAPKHILRCTIILYKVPTALWIIFDYNNRISYYKLNTYVIVYKPII
jgi:hypothetical protein